MSTGVPTVPATTARRLFLAGQGLLDDPRRRVTADVVYETVKDMGFVQVDSISVVARAHHLTLAARLDNYQPALLDRLVDRDRRLFEQWTHDASLIPTVWYPYWYHRFRASGTRIMSNRWWLQLVGPEPEKVIDHVMQRIDSEGPLMAKDFEDEREPGTDKSWWGWKPAKAALEYLWHTGELAITRRVNFQKVYDLARRVLPQSDGNAPNEEEHIDWACRTALERLGVATAEEIAAFWSAVPSTRARAWCQQASASGEVVSVRVESVDGSQPRSAYAVADWEARAAQLAEPPTRIRLLSPFDPIVRDRKRALRLFGFDYHFEAFVPAPKRRFGYYVLPILEGERLIGRLDPKLYRDEGRLEIREVWWEAGVKETKGRRIAVEAAGERLAKLAGVSEVTMPKLWLGAPGRTPPPSVNLPPVHTRTRFRT
jgi:uncharacterized protein YcaQ